MLTSCLLVLLSPSIRVHFLWVSCFLCVSCAIRFHFAYPLQSICACLPLTECNICALFVNHFALSFAFSSCNLQVLSCSPPPARFVRTSLTLPHPWCCTCVYFLLTSSTLIEIFSHTHCALFSRLIALNYRPLKAVVALYCPSLGTLFVHYLGCLGSLHASPYSQSNL